MAVKKSHNRQLVFILGAILIIGALGFLGFKQFRQGSLKMSGLNKNAPESQNFSGPVSCSNPSSFTNYIQGSWKYPEKLTDIKQDTKDFASTSHFYLLLDNRPHLQFPGKLVASLGASSENNLKEYLNKNLIPKILASGYTVDELSTGTGDDKHENIFRKDNEILSVNVGSYLKHPEDLKDVEHPYIYVICGEESPSLLSLYDEILALPDVQKQIGYEMPYAKKIFNLRFEIWENNGNFIQADLGNWNGGGSGIWLTKNESGQWSVFATGQQAPPCDVMEKYHAPPGLFCTDTVHDTLSKTK